MWGKKIKAEELPHRMGPLSSYHFSGERHVVAPQAKSIEQRKLSPACGNIYWYNHVTKYLHFLGELDLCRSCDLAILLLVCILKVVLHMCNRQHVHRRLKGKNSQIIQKRINWLWYICQVEYYIVMENEWTKVHASILSNLKTNVEQKMQVTKEYAQYTT